MRSFALRLVAVTDTSKATVDDHVERAAAMHARLGGRLGILVRERKLSARQVLDLAARLRAAAPQATLLVADRADLAVLIADGVHLGEGDLPVSAARRVVGEKLVTRAAHRTTPQAELAGADAVLVSPIFATPGKEEPRGLSALREATAGGLPVVALGGIDAGNAADCFATGASAVAAIRAWLDPDDGEALARAVLGA